jgi:hypothetical protein
MIARIKQPKSKEMNGSRPRYMQGNSQSKAEQANTKSRAQVQKNAHSNSLHHSPESHSLGFICLNAQVRSKCIVGEIMSMHSFLCRREGVKCSIKVAGLATLVSFPDAASFSAFT